VSRSLVVNVFWLAFAILVTATAIGLVTLWPGDGTIEQPPELIKPVTLGAEITGIAAAPCPAPGQRGCRRVTVELREGAAKGSRAQLTVFESVDRLDLDVGDRIRVFENPLPAGAQVGGVRVDRYSLSDFERKRPLLWLALGFVALVLLTGRWQGLRALLGLVASLALVVEFVVPAILDGASPPGVALVGSLAIMLITLVVTHGLGPKMLAATLGTTCALLLTLGLGSVAVAAAHLTGFTSDEAIYLGTAAGDISLQGLLLAGFLIGALGVLDDLTVTQASIVLALRRANPLLGFRALFRSAVAVGHDHIAATVNTLVLAYAGAALPVLLIFNLGEISFTGAVNSEAVASELVATLVGSIGLIAAVPLTTAFAAVVAGRLHPDALPDADVHAH